MTPSQNDSNGSQVGRGADAAGHGTRSGDGRARQKAEPQRDGGVSVNSTPITQTDIEASNGIVHVIDSVLLPPGVDPIPFLDEILFGLGTLLLANWKRRKDPEVPGKPPIEGEASR